MPLPAVPSTDYFKPNRFIEAGYKETVNPAFSQRSNTSSKLDCQSPLFQQPTFPVESTQWRSAIQKRRSARQFCLNPISYDEFLTICAALEQPIPGQQIEKLEIYAVVHHVAGLQPGLYRSGFYESSHCLKVGEFQAQTGQLCINQTIVRNSAAVFFIVSDYQNYRVALQQAGLIGHRIYLAATALNLGCSGIGAFYDDDTQSFLGTNHPVLYAIAIGQVTQN